MCYSNFLPNSLLLVMIQCTNFYSISQNTKVRVTVCADSPPMFALLVPFSAQISRHYHHSRGIIFKYLYKSSVQCSYSVVSNSLRPHEPQHTRAPCPSPTARVYPNPCSLSQWCHPTMSSSVIPFSSCPQSFQASGSFPGADNDTLYWNSYIY